MKEHYPEMQPIQGQFKLKPPPSKSQDLSVDMTSSHAPETYAMNPNAVVCLPPASEDLRLVWTLADQASELDDNEQLIQSFNRFPYPTVPEIALLCLRYGLQLDKVKVWFMAQRVKYGISWSPEEILEVRAKLSQKQEECYFQPLISSKKQTSENSEQPCPLSAEQTNFSVQEALKTPQTAPVSQGKPEAESQTSTTCQTWELNSIKPDLSCNSVKSEVPCPSVDSEVHDSKELSSLDIMLHANEPCGSSRLAPLATAPPESSAELVDTPQSSAESMGPIEKRPRLSEPPASSSALENYRKPNETVEIISSDSEDEVQEVGSLNCFQGVTGLPTKETGNGMPVHLPDLRCEGLLNSSIDPFQKLDFSGPDLADLENPDLRFGSVSVDQPRRLSLPAKLKNFHSAFSIWNYPFPNGQSKDSPGFRRQRKTKEQLAILKSFFLRCQWAKSEDYSRLEEITGLSRAEIIQWFGDTRYALKHGHLRWFYEGNPEAFPCRLRSLQGPPKDQIDIRSPTSKSGAGNVEYEPLEQYLNIKGHLDDKDVDMLCRESRLNYQQVVDWFASRTQDATAEVVVSLSDDEELYG